MCQCRDKLFSFIDFGTTKLAHLRRRVATPVLLFKIEPPAGKVSLYDKSSVLLRSEMITLTEKVLCRLHITRVRILLISAGGATLHLITGNNTAACIARKSSLARSCLGVYLRAYVSPRVILLLPNCPSLASWIRIACVVIIVQTVFVLLLRTYPDPLP